MGRIWTWVRRTATETGEHPEVPIDLERTAAGAYAFRLGVRAGFGGQEVARIPVGCRTNPEPHPILKEIHHCEVAGRTLEAANVFALRAKVAALLKSIAPGGALPLCYFRAPAMDYELPVYEETGMVVCPVIGGPKLKAPDLAGIRPHIVRYLVNAGYVTSDEEVRVGVLRPRDLRRVPPAAVLRSLAGPEVWVPTVEGISAEGPVVGVLGRAAQLRSAERERAGAGPARGQTSPSAPDVVELLRYVRTEMARSGDAGAATAYAEDVRPEIWAAAERHTEDTGLRLVAHLDDDERTDLELAVRRTGSGELATALEDRGITVLMAPDAQSLAGLAGAFLARHGFLRFASEVEVHEAAAPRPERLDADAIRTFADGEAVTTVDEPQEVHS